MTLQELINLIEESGGGMDTILLLPPNEAGTIEPEVFYDEEYDVAELMHWQPGVEM